MKVAEKFARLNGTVASREEIAGVIAQAKKENNPDIIYRLSKVLNNNPDEQQFKITVIQFPQKGLNGARHKGSYKEALDDCGRLNPGWKFEFGSVIRVTKKPARAISCKRVAPPKIEKVVAKKEKQGKPVSKIDNSKNQDIVGYMLLDSLTAEVVASKKQLSDLKKIFEELEQKEAFSTLDVFVYEIINKSGKNVQGKRVNVDWQSYLKAEVKSKATVLAKDEKRKISDPVKTKTTVAQKASKDYSTNNKEASEQLELLFAEVKGLKCAKPVIAKEYMPVPSQKAVISSNSKVTKIGTQSNTNTEFYTVAGEVGKFLQQVEKKPVESVVVTLDGEQGAGKTTTLYHFMEAFAGPGNKSLYISGEEHPESHLAIDKAKKFLSDKAKESIDTIGKVADVDELYKLIEDYEIIFIDSWQKLLRMVGNIRLDEDLRQKFNGKVFVIIFQQTTTGRAKGGAEVVFDGDIIIKMVKEASFEKNYAYFDKNRYTLIPIETIRYNIASKKCYNPEAKHEIETNSQKIEPLKLSYSFTEN